MQVGLAALSRYRLFIIDSNKWPDKINGASIGITRRGGCGRSSLVVGVSGPDSNAYAITSMARISLMRKERN